MPENQDCIRRTVTVLLSILETQQKSYLHTSLIGFEQRSTRVFGVAFQKTLFEPSVETSIVHDFEFLTVGADAIHC